MTNKRRRQKGSGSVTLRGKTYWIEFQHKGRRYRESAHTTDKDKALAFLKARIGELASGRDIGTDKATIADLCELVIADYKLRGLRNHRGVRWSYEAHIEKLLGPLPAFRFGAQQIRTYVASRQADGASNGTINREFAIIRRGFVLGQQEEPPLVRRAPHIAKLEEGDPRQGFIEQTQYEILLAHLPEHLKCALVIGYHFGCRLGEIRKLRWEQVDFAAGEIRLTAGQTKGKSPRALPMYGDVRDWLERQKEICKGALVFCWQGKALGSHLKGWHRGAKAAGLEGLLFHDLRRSAVRNMVRAGIPEAVAMKISGHKTSSVFSRYNIVAESDLKDAASKMEQFAKESKPKLKRVK